MLTGLLLVLRFALVDRERLLAENLALRHQLGVLNRSVKRPKITDSDRLLWILLRRAFKDWKDTLIFVKPDTVVRWHRKGFRYYWKRKSRARPGRPPISMKLIMLIRQMSQGDRVFETEVSEDSHDDGAWIAPAALPWPRALSSIHPQVIPSAQCNLDLSSFPPSAPTRSRRPARRSTATLRGSLT